MPDGQQLRKTVLVPSTRKVAQCWAGNIAPVPVTIGRHAGKPNPCDGSAYGQAGWSDGLGARIDMGETSNVDQCLRRFGSVCKARAGTVTTKTRRSHAGNITKTRTQTIPRPAQPPCSQWGRTRCRSPAHRGLIPGPPSQITTTRRRKREGKGSVGTAMPNSTTARPAQEPIPTPKMQA